MDMSQQQRHPAACSVLLFSSGLISLQNAAVRNFRCRQRSVSLGVGFGVPAVVVVVPVDAEVCSPTPTGMNSAVATARIIPIGVMMNGSELI